MTLLKNIWPFFLAMSRKIELYPKNEMEKQEYKESHLMQKRFK